METLFLSFFCFINFLRFLQSDQYSGNLCSRYGDPKNFDYLCTNPPFFPTDLPDTVSRLEIVCDNATKTMKITPEDLRGYTYLTTFIVRHCPITDLPDKLFSNNPYLKTVIFENLPVKRIQVIFYDTQNLFEFHIINLNLLEYIDKSIFATQLTFRRIHIDNVPISPQLISQILEPVKQTLTEFIWINVNDDIIFLPEDFFTSFSLGLLDMHGNRVKDFNFLNSLKSGNIILSHTRSLDPHFNFSNYKWFPEFCRRIDLESIGISGTFPNEISKPLIFVKTLFVRGNSIESLNDKIALMFPFLESLDISNNRITHLQADLESLFFNIQYLRLEGNLLHCNCQLKWLSARYKSKIQDNPKCQYGLQKTNKYNMNTYNTNKTLKDIYFSQLSTDSLICLPPRPPDLSIVGEQNKTKLRKESFSMNRENETIKTEYTLIMDSNQAIELSCETDGDPPPVLTWTNQNGTVLVQEIPRRLEKDFLHNKIKVGLSGPGTSSIYVCTASNTEGVSFALMNVKQMDSPTVFNASSLKLLSNNPNSAQSLEFMPVLFIFLFTHFVARNYFL